MGQVYSITALECIHNFYKISLGKLFTQKKRKKRKKKADMWKIRQTLG
jgi:hypothetical protein